MLTKIKEFFRVTKDFLYSMPVVISFKPHKDDDKTSIGLVFENTALKYANKHAITFEGRELNWQQFNHLVNQSAHLLKQQGVKRGDVVSLFIDNRIEMLTSMLALAKIGATTALINNSLRGKALVHCIKIVNSTKCLFGEELAEAIADIKSELSLANNDYLWLQDVGFNPKKGSAPDWAFDFSTHVTTMPNINLPETQDIRAGEQALFIYTSGTTGLPKAAKIYHRRYLSAAFPFSKIGLHIKQKDRMYLCLPLYHITGLGLGFGSAMVSGASVFLRRNFSASQFWPEAQQHQTNIFIYVGELCRYLAMHDKCPEEINNPIKTMLGNGLRPDVWDQFRNRFKVNRITEIYGSSEGNASFINFLNKDKTIGTSKASLMLVKYDIDSDEMLTDDNGKLLEADYGEAGLLIAEMNERYIFDGYQDDSDSDSKIISNVKTQGDRWFNTGDLIRQIDVGFAFGLPHYQFVDRVGDTFRWRSENVSTNEVGEILNQFKQVEISNVYGVKVPGVEGKAGMAALTLHEGEVFDLDEFSQFVENKLPVYARPVFIRLQQQLKTTATFKLLKGELRKESYHLDQVNDPLYVLKPKESLYQTLDKNYYNDIINANSGF